MYVSRRVIKEFKNVIKNSDVIKEDDINWPAPDRLGRQELEVILEKDHISFCTTKLGSLLDVECSKNPEGLRVFYYLVQEIKNNFLYKKYNVK